MTQTLDLDQPWSPVTFRRPVVGLDLSLSGTGVAISEPVDSGAVYFADTLVPPSGWRGVRRLRWIRAAVLDWTRNAHLVVIEGPAYRQGADPGAHERAGLWWLIREALDSREISVAVAAPSAVKKYATGAGNAGKDKVLTAAVRRLPDFDGDNNAADAAWLAAMGADHLGGEPLVPATHRAALAKVAWPEVGE